MKIALIGYGKMGQEIEKILAERGHQVVSIIDVNNQDEINSNKYKSAEVAIEFTNPHAAVENIKNSIRAGVPVVCGSTGWQEQFDKVVQFVTENDSALFHSTNYSLGVNIFNKVNSYLASIMAKYNDYTVEMIEWHHNQKLDAPSGTAITLADTILHQYTNKSGWVNESTRDANKLGIISVRKGDIPGIHTITYESDVDIITFTHDAKGRKGLALGAVLAAEFLAGKKGVYTMDDLLKL